MKIFDFKLKLFSFPKAVVYGFLNKICFGLFLNFKRFVSIVLSYILIYSQITFTFFITNSLLSLALLKDSYAYNEIIPPQNVADNPVNGIVVDNGVGISGVGGAGAGGVGTGGAGVDGAGAGVGTAGVGTGGSGVGGFGAGVGANMAGAGGSGGSGGNGNNAYVDRAQNGTPMVNINNANADGISANYYRDFNVDDQNLILNNYKGESVGTELGGVIYGNPNFNVVDANGNDVGREADLILNEVTSNRVSNISGYIEVAGKKADVIIANPNGIMVGGAGFINVSRLSMITGRSLSDSTGTSFNSVDGKLNPFILTDTNKNPNAVIRVVGKNVVDGNGNAITYNLGIDATNIKYADLVSRVVKINGNIIGDDATEVNVKTGNDKAYYGQQRGFEVVSKTVDSGNNNGNGNNTKEGEDKPEFAIDSTVFGGIQAGRINFIATEDGLAVRNRSDLIATVEDVNFDVNGNILLEDTGNLYAKRNVNLNNKYNLNNKNINNKNNSNNLNNPNNLNNLNSFNNPNNSNNTNNLNNSNNINNFNNSNEVANKKYSIINKSTITAEGNVNIISLSDFINLTTDNKALYAYGDVNISTINSIRNLNGSIIQSDNNINLNSQNSDIINSDGSTIYADNNLNLKSKLDIINTSNSTIYSNNGILNLESLNGNINNTNNGTIYSNQDLTFIALNDIINLNNSTIQSKSGSISLNSDNGSILNKNNSKIYSESNDVKLNSNNGDITNSDNSVIYTINDITLTANNGSIYNKSNSVIQSDESDINLKVLYNIINNDGSTIYSKNNINLELNNTLTNSVKSTIYSDTINFLSKFNDLNNLNDSTISANNDLNIILNNDFNNIKNSVLSSKNNISITTINNTTNNTANNTTNNSANNATNNATNNITNKDNSLIYSELGNIILSTTSSNNSNNSNNLGNSNTTSSDILNSDSSTIYAKSGSISLNSDNGSILNKNNSKIYSESNDVKLNSNNGDITNSDNSIIYSAKDLTITSIANNTNNANNNNTTNTQNSNTTNINRNNIINSLNSIIQSANNLNITVDGNIINNNESIIKSTDSNISLITNHQNIINNNNSNIVAKNDITMSTSNLNYINNQQGIIASNNNLIINSNVLDNTNKGYIYSNNNTILNILSILNNSDNGTIESNNNIFIITNDFYNNNGTVLSTNNILNSQSQTTSSSNQSITASATAASATATSISATQETSIAQETSATQETLTTQETNSIISIKSNNSLNNINGNIKSNGDIDINILTDYIINGTLYSNSNININAKNITNNSDVISANNIIFTANNGNVYNGSANNINTNIIAMNSIIFNILKQGNTNSTNNTNSTESNSGNLYNYGKISANNNILINAEDSVYNGLTEGSDATITANNNNIIIAGKKIINKGFIQATGLTDNTSGQKIVGTGNLILTTNAEINGDYLLNENSTTSKDLYIKIDDTVSPEVQAKLDNINSINDTEELKDLLTKIKTSQQYYKIQDRILILDIKEKIKDLQEDFTFKEDDWTIGNTIKVYKEDPNDPDKEIESYLTLDETLFQDMLSSLLENNYKKSDWDISDKIKAAENNIETEIQEQQTRFKEYNNKERLKAEEEYKQNNNDSLDGFNWTDYTMEQYVSNNQDIETNGILTKDSLMNKELNQIYQERLTKLQNKFAEEKSKADNASLIDWDNINKNNIQPLLKELLTENYDSNNWTYEDFNDGSETKINDSLRTYLYNLRLNETELHGQNIKNRTEQTGIHNYGRLYSNADMNLKSNSVLHNNKGSLIHSKNNIIFNVNNTIFNNENTIGQGIFANGNIDIKGYTDDTKLKKLINYDGRIESNGNIDIKANSVLNYGSDSIDIRENPYLATNPYTIKYFDGYPSYNTPFQLYMTNGYESTLTSNSSYIQSNNGDINIEIDDTTLTNSLINHNSNIYGNNVRIVSPIVLNTHTEFYVIGNQHYRRQTKKKRRPKRPKYRKYDYYEAYNILLSTLTPSRIVARNTVSISSDNLTNGSIKESNTTYSPNGNNIAYSPNKVSDTPFNNITKTGTINPLDFISSSESNIKSPDTSNSSNNNTITAKANITKENTEANTSETIKINLPQGNYGIFRPAKNPDSKYLYETDPTLTDTNQFLGSTYFMNRLGLDPNTIDLKFLGDNYLEYDLIKKSLEQIYLTQNIHLDPQTLRSKIDSLYNSMSQQKAEQLGLTFGEPITEQQRSSLTEDIIWYTKQKIQLPNGEIYEALVPQIYLCDSTLSKLKNQLILTNIGSLISGNDVLIQSNLNGNNNLSSSVSSSLLNSGMIKANNNLVISGFNTVNNISSSIKYSSISSLLQDILDDKLTNKSFQATITSGNTLIINTGTNGTVNNLSGLISLNNKNNNSNTSNNNNANTNSNNNNNSSSNLLYINTGTLNNLTLSQQEEINIKSKNYEFNKISTNIGDTATISSNNNNSNIIISAENDINILGGNITATSNNNNTTNTNSNSNSNSNINNSNSTNNNNNGNNINNNNNTNTTNNNTNTNNSNITLSANNININTIQDYEYQREYSKNKGGLFGSKTTKEDITQSLTNIGSNIIADNNISIITGHDLTSIGTNFTSNNGGDINLDIGNDLNLYNAMDYNYEYHYKLKEKFDVASAVTNVAAAVASAALVASGAGAPLGAAMASATISSGISASQMKKGKLTITSDYDEKTIANNLTGNNINITTGNDFNSVSTVINNNPLITTPLPFNTEWEQILNNTIADNNNTNNNINSTNTNTNNTNNNTININIRGNTNIQQAQERHEHSETHEKWGGNIGRAALSGSITGLASGLGVKGGEAFGNMAGNGIESLLGSNAISGSISSGVNAGVGAMTISASNTIGNAMSSTVLNGGSLWDALYSGIKSAGDKETLKSMVVSGVSAGVTTGVSDYIDKDFNNVISNGKKVGANFRDRFYSNLLENSISGAVDTAIESTVQGDSLKKALGRQLINTVSNTVGTLGANEIGAAYKNGNINKLTQLGLHAGLGAVMSGMTGNDIEAGAVSGAFSELIAGLLTDNKYNGAENLKEDQRNSIIEISGLVGGLSSIIISSSKGDSLEDIASNAYSGQRIGKNAAKNNATYIVMSKDKKTGKVIDAKKDGDATIYDVENGNKKVGETLFDDDYVDREGDEINFDTKIGRALGEDGLYGDNAEEMIGALINFEGDMSKPYVDSKNILTIGFGMNINTWTRFNEAEILDKAGNLVTNQAKRKVYNYLINYKTNNKIHGPNYINNYFNSLDYEISDKNKYSILVKDIKNSRDLELPKKFPNYNDYPTSVRMGLLDLEYNMGGNFKENTRYGKNGNKLSDGWPNMYNSVRNENWNKAAKDSYRKDVQGSRNKWTKEKFIEGATNKSNILNNYKYNYRINK